MTSPTCPTHTCHSGEPYDPFADAMFDGHPACRMAAWIPGSEPDQPLPLSDTETARLERLKSPRVRSEMEASFILRRRLIAAMTGSAAGSVELGMHVEGAPVLRRPEGWSLSLAHKGALTVVAMAPSPGAIGVDVEHVRPIDWKPILSMVCSDHERSALLSDAGREDASLRRFYRMWTLKEAVLKSTLQGFRAGPKSVATPLSALEGPGSGNLSAFGDAFEFWTVDAGDAVISLVRRRG